MEKYNLTQTGQEVQDILDNATPQSDLTVEVERAQEAERLLGEGIQQNADDIDSIEGKIPSAATSENKLTDKEYVDGLVDDEKNRAQDAEQQNADDIDAIEAIIPSNASSENKLATSNDVDTVAQSVGTEETRAKAAEKQNADDIDAIESVIPLDATSENKLATVSDITTEATTRENADAALQSAIEAILLLIPSAASSLNKLADKAFVNSSIATNTATFRGTFNLVNDLHLTLAATHAQIGNALALAILESDNNDYAYVQIPTSDATPTQIAKTERYKFNGTAWEYEYDLNNSGYTAAQWAAINSGITEALVAKLSALPTNADLTTALGVLTSSITAINQKIPSAASQANQLVDTTAMESYIVQVLDVLTASFNVTSSDGHVTVQISQVDGKITSFALTTLDIASAASLSLVEGRVTTAEGNISTNSADIAILQDAYAALTQSEMVVIAPTDTWPVANPEEQTIYRVVDRTNTPPQYYSDYMWNGTTMVLMATYNNAIDPRPKKASQNLVTSGGVFDNMGALDVSELNATENPHTLAQYVDLSAALAAIPTDYQKGGMSIKFVQSSDNNYVQYRLTSNEWSTDTNDWQDIDTNELNREILGDFHKRVIWSNGYISNQGIIKNSTLSKYSQPFLLKKGERVTVGTLNPNITVIGSTTSDSLDIDDTVTIIQRIPSTQTQFSTYSYTATEDILIVVCVLKSNYTLSFFNENNIKDFLSNTDDVPTTGSNNLVKSGGVKSEISSLSQFVGKEPNVVWFSAYINSLGGVVTSSSISLTSQPFMLYAGESVTVTTKNANIGIICRANSGDTIAVGDSVIVLERTSSAEMETHTYTAEEDTWIVICVLAAEYSVSFDIPDINARIAARTPAIKNGQDDLSFEDYSGNVLVLFKNGHIKTEKFDSSYIEYVDDDADLVLSDPKKNVLIELRNGHIKTSKFNSEEVLEEVSGIPQYISAEQYNQIPIDKCNYDKVARLAMGTVYKGKVTRIYEQSNFIARIALFGDLHVGYGYSFTNVPTGSYDGYGWKNWEDYVELSLKRASNKVPDFGIALGDQLSAINNSLYYRGGVGLIERNDWYNRIRQFNYPLFNVFGNHDDAVPDFIHTGVIEIRNIKIIVFHMDIIYTTPLSTYNISDAEFAWLENAVKDSYNKGFITILASHYPIISDAGEGSIPQEYIGVLLVNNHGQDLLDLCQTYNVRLHIHGHTHPTGLPHIIMKNNGVDFDMTEVELGLGARAYTILEIRDDGFHFTEYPITRGTGTVVENNIRFNIYEILDDAAGRTLFVPLYNQKSGTVRSDDWTPYPGTEKE